MYKCMHFVIIHNTTIAGSSRVWNGRKSMRRFTNTQIGCLTFLVVMTRSWRWMHLWPALPSTTQRGPRKSKSNRSRRFDSWGCSLKIWTILESYGNSSSMPPANGASRLVVGGTWSQHWTFKPTAALCHMHSRAVTSLSSRLGTLLVSNLLCICVRPYWVTTICSTRPRMVPLNI